ncbi:MAG: FAD-binding oxidoreductase, partial [Pseudomonadota bacterium]
MRDDRLATRLRAAIEGDVLFDLFDRGRYATDASVYQVIPAGVVVPRSWADVEAAMEIAREDGLPITARGGGSSQCGQTVNHGLVIDFSKHLNRVLDVDEEAGEARVEPGLVLDRFNRSLKSTGLWFPVDVSTSSRATLGGMAANNSGGSRSLRYGIMRDNVISLDAYMADGALTHFGATPRRDPNARLNDAESLTDWLLDLGAREADEIQARFPKLNRRVGGYNIDALVPNGATNNLAHLMIGSEGTLGITREIRVKLSPQPGPKMLGVCHFPTFRDAMEAPQHLVDLGPTAIELVDSNMISLGRDIPLFRPVVDLFVRGDPAALLLVEFAEPDPKENRRRLTALGERMAELGYRWGDPGKKDGGVVEAEDPAFQKQIWEIRKQGLNIMMSMRSDGKPVSFGEVFEPDGAVLDEGHRFSIRPHRHHNVEALLADLPDLF